MAIPGYDPDDLERVLRAAIADDPDSYLTAEERRRHASGEELVDLLDEEDIDRIVAKHER
jgi:hypothetical protein